MLKPDF